MYRYSVLVAVATLVVIVSGAIVTSAKAASSLVPQLAHVIMAFLALALTAGLALWPSSRVEKRALGWIAVAVLCVDGVLGRAAALSVLHASLAPVLFSIVIAIALLTSPAWEVGPELVEDPGASSLRLLAIATPPLVLAQVVLGALYRHQATGVLPHMAGAMVVSLLTMVVSMLVIQRFPTHRPLYRAAVTLLTTVLAQVSLGITAFILRLLDTENTPWFLVSAISHVAVGALTVAASVVLVLQIRRNVRPVP